MQLCWRLTVGGATDRRVPWACLAGCAACVLWALSEHAQGYLHATVAPTTRPERCLQPASHPVRIGRSPMVPPHNSCASCALQLTFHLMVFLKLLWSTLMGRSPRS